MLTEIKCEHFRDKRIEFSEGLNVVLGDEKATNSIGKSTLLMVIDFIYGGSDFLEHNYDVVEEFGHHEYLFSFLFDDRFYFKRGTYAPDLIYVCDEEYNEVKPIEKKEYTDFLQEKYASPKSISFRSCVAGFSRVWGKENLNPRKPLQYFSGQSAGESINNIIKIYDQFESISEISAQLSQKTEENRSLNKAIKNNIVPKILKSKYNENSKVIIESQSEIQDIEKNLEKFALSVSEIISKETLEAKEQKDSLIATKYKIKSQLNRLKKNKESSHYLKSRNLKKLEDFFPEVNTTKLLNIEDFHNGLRKILTEEINEKESELEKQLSTIEKEIVLIDQQISELSNNIKKPNAIITRVRKISDRLKEAQLENSQYEKNTKIKDDLRTIKSDLNVERERITSFISNIVNDKIRKIITLIYSEHRKSPNLSFSSSNYNYEIYEDTGTGKAFSNLLVFDLALFQTSKLPFLIHDSLLFKNIENNAVANIIGIYASENKQSFIAIDEISKYGKEASDKLIKNKAIQLNDQHVLYTKDWRD
ncbi:DUF2326 domain-containing protein [Endozoicomonas sp. SESOKO3]|uniref:DUF2326 domain-containing protein n=2 Tax=unclassified Endozoicomonas TaxID=2644528 RepID=UPI0021498488|nr:DUF2326 domain-containing protein [Endozoicomonas sp. SESOKO3]